MITNFTTPVYEELQLADGTDLNNVNPEIEVREDMKYAYRFYRKVIDYHPELLPRPKKITSPDQLRVETLKEIPIITVRCELNEV